MSSFFPDKRARQPVAQPARNRDIESSISSEWHGIRMVSPSSTGPADSTQQLKFPAVRNALWDRTPHGATRLISPMMPKLRLSPAVIAPLAMRAASLQRPAPDINHSVLGRASISTFTSLASDDLPDCSSGRTSGCVEICANSLEFGAPMSKSSGAPVRCEAGTMEVMLCDWRTTGGTLIPSERDYEEMLRRAGKALQASQPLSVSEMMPMYAAPSHMWCRMLLVLPMSEFVSASLRVRGTQATLHFRAGIV
ncbi:MAG: hypothetical protein SGPRY_008784 [Prymnesium sp.]